MYNSQTGAAVAPNVKFLAHSVLLYTCVFF